MEKYITPFTEFVFYFIYFTLYLSKAKHNSCTMKTVLQQVCKKRLYTIWDIKLQKTIKYTKYLMYNR